METAPRRLTLTPQLAEELLASNDANRPIRENKWRGIARDIAADRYIPNYDPVVAWVRPDGTRILLNGQHRCLAVIEARTSISVFYLEVDNPDAMLVQDTGAVRSFNDYLVLRRIPDPAGLGSSTRILWRFKNNTLSPAGDFKKRKGPTQGELWDLFVKYDAELRAGAKVARATVRLHPGTNRTAITVAHVVLRELNPSKSEQFFSGLTRGTGELTELDPRALFIRRIGQQTRLHSLDAPHQIAYLVKAWNAWISGRSISNLSWHPFAPEPFPQAISG